MSGSTPSKRRIAVTTGAALAIFCGVLVTGAALANDPPSALPLPGTAQEDSAGSEAPESSESGGSEDSAKSSKADESKKSGRSSGTAGKPAFTTAEAMTGSEPVSLDIPAIGVKGAPIDPVGLNADRTVEVPALDRPELVGWYKHRPTPGEAGPAVLLGHVDAYGRPAVFARTHTLEPGDTVRVKRADGRTAVFTVDELERVDKDAFPTDRVYGETATPELRLITCGGAFDPATGHYEDNIIVYAHLKA
ncbi:class F sortase [Planomonospora sp. ID91781]|uniref:class F sortase n=1 Tax=Planomonospora sp. ID91781 TaxID=2738135 RepID=UPI0018C3528A|nr:class F sortase [Planomonospora sp. ID91781]